MQRDELLTRIRSGRARLDEVLARISDDRMLDRPADDAWSGKDQLAHLLAWHRVTLNRITGNLPSEEEMSQSIDEINERFFERDRDAPLDDVRREFSSTYDRICEAIEGMTDADLDRPWHPDRSGAEPLGREIGWDTFDHYAGHLGAFQALAG